MFVMDRNVKQRVISAVFRTKSNKGDGIFKAIRQDVWTKMQVLQFSVHSEFVNA